MGKVWGALSSQCDPSRGRRGGWLGKLSGTFGEKAGMPQGCQPAVLPACKGGAPALVTQAQANEVGVWGDQVRGESPRDAWCPRHSPTR